MARRVREDREQRREAFARDLSDALQVKGLTLEAVSRRLTESGHKVSVATLSYWQNGLSMPTRTSSREALTILEPLLDLSPGRLTRHVTGGSAWYPEEVTPADLLGDMVQELGLSPERRFRLLGAQEVLHVDADRRTATQVVRQFMRVEGEREQAVLFAVADEDGPPPSLRASVGCRVGRHLADEASGLLVARLELPRPMQQGDQFWLEYTVEWGAAPHLRDRTTRVLAQLTSLVTMDVVFAGEPPRQASYRTQHAEAVPDVERVVPVLDDRLGVVLADVAPGEHTLKWQW